MRRRIRTPAGARGFALPVALLLLAVLGVLAASGMSTASMELQMASRDQARAEAAAAALAGIELGIARIAAGVALPAGAPARFGGSIAPDSPARYEVEIREVAAQPAAVEAGGRSLDLVQYEITSRGTARPQVVEEQVQGVVVATIAAAPAGAEPREAVARDDGLPAQAPDAGDAGVACMADPGLLPRCVKPGTPVRTYWYSRSTR